MKLRTFLAVLAMLVLAVAIGGVKTQDWFVESLFFMGLAALLFLGAILMSPRGRAVSDFDDELPFKFSGKDYHVGKFGWQDKTEQNLPLEQKG